MEILDKIGITSILFFAITFIILSITTREDLIRCHGISFVYYIIVTIVFFLSVVVMIGSLLIKIWGM